MTLVVTRGLPGSGKTTAAQEWADREPQFITTRVILSRDSLRFTMFRRSGVLDQESEVLITKALLDLVKANLVAGHHVCVDAQHLRDRDVRKWRDVAFELGHIFQVIDKRDVPLEVCLTHNAHRIHPVPEAYIRQQHERFIKGRNLSAPLPEGEPAPAPKLYVPDTSKPKAWILDVDGTVANHEGIRDPHDTSRYHLDTGHEPVIRLAQALAYMGETIIVTSGRSDEFRPVTSTWLDENFVPAHYLFMRKAGDQRRDDTVKAEIFWRDIAPNFNVVGAIDDRDRVVALWRGMGIKCLQAQPGDF